jgi:putative Holliday junction resolvase
VRRAAAGAGSSNAPVTLLCFDYGEKRIGVAVGQTLTGTATALSTLAARAGAPDWNALAALLAEWDPDALVLGLPLNMDGTEQPLTARVRRFARRLSQRHPLPLYFADERLSTREARSREGAAAPREGRDALAAQIILEGWMAGARLDA